MKEKLYEILKEIGNKVERITNELVELRDCGASSIEEIEENRKELNKIQEQCKIAISMFEESKNDYQERSQLTILEILRGTTRFLKQADITLNEVKVKA